MPSVLTYERGEGEQRLDWVNIPASDLTAIPGGPGALGAAQAYVYPGIWMLVPSNGQEPFQNDEVGLKVRRALSHAVDRSRLVELTNGLPIEAYGMVPTGVFGYIDDPEIAAIQAFDPAHGQGAAGRNALRGRPELARDHDAHARRRRRSTTPT